MIWISLCSCYSDQNMPTSVVLRKKKPAQLMKLRGFPCFRRQTLLQSSFLPISLFSLSSAKRLFYVFLVFTETNLARLEIYTEIAELPK